MAGERDELAEDGGSVYAAVMKDWFDRTGPFARFALDLPAAAEGEAHQLEALRHGRLVDDESATKELEGP